MRSTRERAAAAEAAGGSRLDSLRAVEQSVIDECTARGRLGACYYNLNRPGKAIEQFKLQQLCVDDL